MKRSVVTTADGSHSLWAPEFDEHYHSVHGAIQESRHVFLKMGWEEQMHSSPNEIAIFEMGFGTGLNTLLTVGIAQESGIPVNYSAIEKYPITQAEAASLNYAQASGMENGEAIFQKLHEAPWGEPSEIIPGFQLTKIEGDLEAFSAENAFDLIYFDAFAPNSQPELWSEAIFAKLFMSARAGAILTTYCAQGKARRAMIAAGWQVEKVPGPPGKREMLRARKG